MKLNSKRNITPEFEVSITLNSMEIEELIKMIEYDSVVMGRTLPCREEDASSLTDKMYIFFRSLL